MNSDNDDLDAARGIYVALAISGAIWLGVAILLWMTL